MTSYSSNVSQIITSPNYPLPYAPNLNCRWTIDGPADGQIEVAVTVIDIENSTNCENGYLEIRDATTDPVLAGRVCAFVLCFSSALELIFIDNCHRSELKAHPLSLPNLAKSRNKRANLILE